MILWQQLEHTLVVFVKQRQVQMPGVLPVVGGRSHCGILNLHEVLGSTEQQVFANGLLNHLLVLIVIRLVEVCCALELVLGLQGHNLDRGIVVAERLLLGSDAERCHVLGGVVRTLGGCHARNLLASPRLLALALAR